MCVCVVGCGDDFIDLATLPNTPVRADYYYGFLIRSRSMSALLVVLLVVVHVLVCVLGYVNFVSTRIPREWSPVVSFAF